MERFQIDRATKDELLNKELGYRHRIHYELQYKEAYENKCLENGHVDPSATIHPTARIGKKSIVLANAVIGPGVTLGDEVVIEDRVIIGANSTVGAKCLISRKAEIGPDVKIGVATGVSIYTIIKKGVSIGDNCLICCYKIEKNSQIGNKVFLGNNSHIRKNVTIEDNNFLDNNIHLGKECWIKENCAILHAAVLKNNVSVDNSHIKARVFIGAKTNITNSLIEEDGIIKKCRNINDNKNTPLAMSFFERVWA